MTAGTEGPLLHLTTPPEWRAALATGAVTPPSLAEVGFVHLSSPEQVHLPAERLFAGRRDVVLLVVDPARLTDPVRLEPGVPGDPASMRFPHLYGPLPTSAVIAVLPWRPGEVPVPPDPSDALGRARAMDVALRTRRAARVVDVHGGHAVADPAFPHSRDDNRLLVTGSLTADEVEAQAVECAAALGWTAPAVTLLHPDAGPVAAELGRRGWDVATTLLMARWAPFPAAADGPAEVVPQSEVHALWDRSWRAELGPGTPDLEEVVRQLVGREHRNDRVVRVVDVAVREGGGVVAAAQLRVDGATASLESVGSDPAVRRRGLGTAVLDLALATAGAAGCDLVVLDAAADDWPRHWYARHGFTEAGRTWDAVRP
ncbi:GNAT family N-acetyltransferase [Modestobacter sp. VKM Ac-2986]|uniref:GNAT family N-acetyltransferase n=1 Tax=Modestobacter sp. VKM Ac-2986 TaxID=3004140 RepID=UPI0022AB6BE0|nr:GNAT family N-acetyltransferase [Modestobacter sp. VKM Ac-2986]MCZ2829431.1 GNAT family N-acetyltransferase [Modestobacter sp. VKM Ac-2986]